MQRISGPFYAAMYVYELRASTAMPLHTHELCSTSLGDLLFTVAVCILAKRRFLYKVPLGPMDVGC